MLSYHNLYSILLSFAPIFPRFLWGLGWVICIIDLNENKKRTATAPTKATATIGFLEDDIASITFFMVYAYARKQSYS